jgi:hypothetical protein
LPVEDEFAYPSYPSDAGRRDLAVETELVGMISHNLTLGAVPGGVDVAGLGHLPEEAEVLHDELL